MEDRHALLRKWIDIDSVNPGERAFLEALEADLIERGYAVERQPVAADRWNLLATRRPDPALLYSTHVDTVPPFIPARMTDDAVFGRGACDTKGGIVAMIEAGDRLAAAGHDDFGYLFVVGEEVDHVGAMASTQLDLHPRRIVLCEPTANRVVAAQKGLVRFTVRTTGVAGHSAYPDKGHSAVHDLLEVLAEMRDHAWPEHDILGPTTLNVGVISGGVAANVFAPSAEAQVMIRAVSPAAEVVSSLQGIAGDKAEVEIIVADDPVIFDPPAGVETCVVAFFTDATWLAELGPVWLVGPGEIEVAHGVDEHVTFASLAAGVDLYEKLGRLVLEGGGALG